MKLHHFVAGAPSEDARKLRDLGKSLVQVATDATIPVAEAAKAVKKPEAEAVSAANMDAAIHTMTQDQKHLHKKLAHHD